MELPPRSGRVVAWGNAVLAGVVSPDDGDAGAVGRDAQHRVLGVPGADGPVSWAVAYGLLRRAGVTRLRLALPVPGDPAGLAGPAPTTAAAIAAGQAVVTEGATALVVVPTTADSEGGPVVRWDVWPAAEPAPASGDVAAADRELRQAILAVGDALVDLDLGRDRPEAWREVGQAERRAGAQPLPPTLPSPAVALLRSAVRIAATLALAVEDDGAAVTAGEAAARREALAPLARAARVALVAAYGAGADAARSAAGDGRG